MKKVRIGLPDGNGCFGTLEFWKQYFSDIGEKTIAEDREDGSFIWENYFDEETNINEYYLSVFVRAEDGRYDKFTENHYEKAYYLEEIRQALNEAGLEYITAYEAFTKNPADDNQERVYVIARANK